MLTGSTVTALVAPGRGGAPGAPRCGGPPHATRPGATSDTTETSHGVCFSFMTFAAAEDQDRAVAYIPARAFTYSATC